MDSLLFTDEYDFNKTIIEKDSFIEVKGGDGTLIQAISKFRHLYKPFFGIARGTVNFLMNTSSEISTDSKIMSLNLIKVDVTYILHEFGTYNETLKTKSYYAFNDLVLGGFNAWIKFDCKHDDDILGGFHGSGIIVSTAQGSTGINKNNSGVILPLPSEDWSITGMQCNRNINYILEPKEIAIDCNSRQTVNLAIDGNNTIIQNVKSVKITKGESVDVIFNNIQQFKKKRRI